MQGKQERIVIVDESRRNLLLHVGRLAVELRLKIGRLYRVAVLILSLVGNLAGLGLPLPHVRSLEESGDFPVPGIADRLDLPIRIETVGFGDLFENWRALLRPGVGSKDQHSESQKTNHRTTARFCHRSPLFRLNGRCLVWRGGTILFSIIEGARGRVASHDTTRSLPQLLPCIRIPAALPNQEASPMDVQVCASAN